MKIYSRRIIIALLSTMSLLAITANAGERSAQRAFDQVRHDPVGLRGFLQNFPKGGDLHNHIDGAVYAESMIAWAAEDGKCIDLVSYQISPAPCNPEQDRPAVSDIAMNGDVVNNIIDAFSVRNFARREVSGHNQFFATFFKFDAANGGRQGDMIAEVTNHAAEQNIGYLELMQSWGMADARATASLAEEQQNKKIEKITIESMAILDRAEQRQHELQQCDQAVASAACDVKVAYIAQVIRVFPRQQVRAQVKLAARLVELDPRVVGITFVAPEDAPTSLRDYHWQMQMLADQTKHLADDVRNINLHAGELSLGLVSPQHLGWHIRDAIETAGANRIGHGVDIIYDPMREQLLNSMAENGIAVEINLTSNDVILGVAEDEHPFNLYREYGVPITLSTDDEGVLRTDLTHQYQRAVLSYNLSYHDIKQVARNAIEFSFQAGESLFADIARGSYVQPCRKLKKGTPRSEQCSEFLNNNNKANLQWGLEKRFSEFEIKFK